MDSVGVPHSQIFRPKGSMIVASYGSEPSRSFVFGPKPYAQHPFDFELAPSTTISGVGGHRRRERLQRKAIPGLFVATVCGYLATVCGYCLWLTVCGYCLWLLFVATVCGYCLWLLFVATVCGYCLWLLFGYCLWLLFVATVCGCCLWLLFVATVCGCCLWLLFVATWLLFVATVCGYCLWLLFVATVCGYCLWLLFVATVCGYCLWLLFVATRRKPTWLFADQPTGKPSAVAASRFSEEQRANAWGV